MVNQFKEHLIKRKNILSQKRDYHNRQQILDYLVKKWSCGDGNGSKGSKN